MQDKALYQQAFEELNAGTIDPALWAMVWTKAGGDDAKARANYVEARVGDILLAQRRERKAALPPWPQRIPRGLVSLAGSAAVFAVINQHVADAYAPTGPNLRWDFYLVGTAGYSLGLLAFPALALLIGRKSRWGLRLAFLILLIVGCFSGMGGISPDAPDRMTPIWAYRRVLLLLVVGWGFCMLWMHESDERRLWEGRG